MELVIMENGLKIFKMESELNNGKINQIIVENFLKEKKMVMDIIYGQMVQNIKENGKIII